MGFLFFVFLLRPLLPFEYLILRSFLQTFFNNSISSIFISFAFKFEGLFFLFDFLDFFFFFRSFFFSNNVFSFALHLTFTIIIRFLNAFLCPLYSLFCLFLILSILFIFCILICCCCIRSFIFLSLALVFTSPI